MIKKLFLILICICFFTGTVSAASDEISSLEAVVEVDSSGACLVTLTLQVQFATPTKEFLIPLGTDAYDVYASGAFDTDSQGDVEYAVFENAFGFSGTQSFSCSYRLPCTMSESEGGQYFTLLLPEQGFTLPIRRYQITVRFPVEVTELPTWKSSYYQDVLDNYLNIQVTENVVTAASTIAFQDHETVTMKLRFQPDSFDLRNLAGQTTGFTSLFFLLFATVTMGYWFLRLRRSFLRKDSLQATNLDSSAGELPCQLHSLSPDMASLLAHWGNLGYVVIRKNRRGQLYIEKRMDMGNERKVAEQHLFQALFGRFDHCEIPSGRFLRAAQQAGEGLRTSWMRRIFRRDSGSPFLVRGLSMVAGAFVSIQCFDLLLSAKPSRWFWLIVLSVLGIVLFYIAQQMVYATSRRDGKLRLILGVAATITWVILGYSAGCLFFVLLTLGLQFFCFFTTRYGGLRNDSGKELLKEFFRLRSFLRKADGEEAQHKLDSDSHYFYKMLPYAEMMGFGASFVRRFGAGGSEPCRWLISERREPKNAEEFYTFYCEVISEIRIAQKPSRLQTILTNLFHRPKPRQTRKPAGRDRTRRTIPDRTRRTTSDRTRRTTPDRRRTGSRPTARRR